MKKTLLWTSAAIVGVTLAAGGVLTQVPEAKLDTLFEEPSAITWGQCPTPPPGLTVDPKQQCADVTVPLDYRKPDGRTITIAVSRIPAADQAKRRGVLLLNPGGPGGEGLNMPTFFGPAVGKDLLASYDLIGFDPRGVGHSSPVTCGLTPSEIVPPYPYPAADGSITANVRYAKSAADRCAAKSGDLLPYVTTANTARDMDRIREALGEKRISYYGTSYGTYLGAVYASLFAKHTDRMVLDSAIDPSKIWYEQFHTQSRGQAVRFPDLAAYVVSKAETLKFGTTTPAVTASYLRLTASLDASPVTVPGAPVPLSGNVLRGATTALLASDQAIPMIAEGWRAAADLAAGRATEQQVQTLQGMIGAITASASASPGVPADNPIAAAYALACGDVRWPDDVRKYEANVATDRKTYPLSAGAPANIWPCAFWKSSPIEAPVAISARGARNVLILQNERDPLTPLETGRGMRRALGQRSVLVTINAGGHGVWNGQAPDSCAKKTADRFLVGGVLPERDTRCA